MGKSICMLLAVAAGAAAAESGVLRYVEESGDAAVSVAQDIWGYAELGYLEEQSTRRLQRFLTDRGFAIETGVAGIPTAFLASRGSGKPVIGILAEFDALPGLSQAAVPHRQPRVEDAPGHACGHNLFGRRRPWPPRASRRGWRKPAPGARFACTAPRRRRAAPARST